MRRFIISESARSDLRDIKRYLLEIGTEAAYRVLHELRAGMRRVVREPEIGHFRGDLTALDVRFYKVHRYLIIYEFDDVVCAVVRILHGSRDIERLLRNP